jgi:hypothetical protein
MDEIAMNSDEARDAVAAYLAASEAALLSIQQLNAAWRLHFEANAEPPLPAWIAEVSALQVANDLALGRARAATAVPISVKALASDPATSAVEPNLTGTKRRRHRKNKFLSKVGRRGQRLLRAILLALLAVSVLVATGAGISLALEIAGFLHLIDDPVQLPVGIQLAIFLTATALAFGLKRVLKPVERALYGSKGIRPRAFPL